jgi:NAD(P)-dependent dehydrogenase (short-subunit alcohol dehydrogenase family)
MNIYLLCVPEMIPMAKRAAPRRRRSGSPASASRPLAGAVAIVAGATRGAGRGIARGLGEAGAIVYCTGRSTREAPSPYKRPETIEETAELVTAAGGRGIAVRVDHTIDEEVRELARRVSREQKGKLDVLVSSIAGEDPSVPWQQPLPKIDIALGLRMFQQSVFSHLCTAKYAAPLMIKRRSGLIVEVTEGDTLSGGVSLLHHLVKSGLKHLAFAMADELRKHRVTVVSITPGFLRSESMLEHFKATEANWRDGAKKDRNFLISETPLFVGRAVAALAADPEKAAKTGQVTSSWELAREYNLTDADGSRPDWGLHLPTIMSEYGWLRDGFQREAAWLDQLSGRAKKYAGG